MNIIAHSTVNPFVITLDRARKFGECKVQAINHDGECLAFLTPPMSTPFGLNKFSDTSNFRITLDFDEDDEEHIFFREMLHQVHEQLAKSATAPCAPIVEHHPQYGDRFKINLDVKDLSDFAPIKDLEGNLVEDGIPPRARVRAVVHVQSLWTKQGTSGIKLKAKRLQLVSVEQDTREPSPEVDEDVFDKVTMNSLYGLMSLREKSKESILDYYSRE